MVNEPTLDPNLTAEQLHALAGSRPDLWASIAAHPNAYPDLLNHMSIFGEASVLQALSARGFLPTPLPPLGGGSLEGADGKASTSGTQPASAPGAPSSPPGAPEHPHQPAAPTPTSSGLGEKGDGIRGGLAGGSKGRLMSLPFGAWVGFGVTLVVAIAGLIFLTVGGVRGGERPSATVEGLVEDVPPSAVELDKEDAGWKEKEQVAPPTCVDGEILEDGVCVPGPPTCPAGVQVPGVIDANLVCGGVPAGAVPITAGSQGMLLAVTPSGNIGCEMDPSRGKVSCKISRMDWPEIEVPLGPGASSSCTGFNLEEGGDITVNCGTAAPKWALVYSGQYDGTYQTMEYGNNYTLGGAVCNSADTGLTCWDPNSAHGFFLSRESWEQW